MKQMTRKELCYLEEGFYAKQDISMSIIDLFKIPPANKENSPRLKITQEVNGRVHTFSASYHPTYRDAFILQVLLSEAGLRLYNEGEVARINDNSPERFKVMVEKVSKEASEVRSKLGLSSQIVFETTYNHILKKAGMSTGRDSRKALIESLERMSDINHKVYVASEYRNGEKGKGFNESFINYEFDDEVGLVRVKLNSLLSTALTGQFTLINLNHKTGYVKNEKYLAMYDFIAGKVNKGERRGFNLNDAIKTVESIEGDVSKYLRNKYKKILKTLNENKSLGEIEFGNKGDNAMFVVKR